MAYEDFKDLAGRAASDKILLDKANGSLNMFQWFTNSFMYNLREIMLLSTCKSNQQLADKLWKPIIIKKFQKCKADSSFM